MSVCTMYLSDLSSGGICQRSPRACLPPCSEMGGEEARRQGHQTGHSGLMTHLACLFPGAQPTGDEWGNSSPAKLEPSARQDIHKAHQAADRP